MMPRARLLSAVVVSAVGLGLVSVAPSVTASASPRPASKSPAIGGKVKVDAKAIEAYWTPERRASAKDVDIIVRSAPRTESVRPVKTGKPGSVPGGAPSGEAVSNGSNTRLMPDSFAYPFPYDSWNVPPQSYKRYPYSVNGKIFFTNNGGNFVCSGTTVASVNGTGNENEVWTAGHCLVNTNVNDQHLDSFLEFVPAYNGTKTGKKQTPLGVFTWNGAWETASNWFNHRDLSEDEAAFTVNTNAKGQTLGNVTGWAGFKWNQSTDQQFVAFGYPAESPYSGNLEVTDLGASAVLDTGVGGAGSPPIGIGNPMTGGSSGGAWLTGWSNTDPGYINGHNDYKYGSQPLAMYSTYQDSLSNLVRCLGTATC